MDYGMRNSNCVAIALFVLEAKVGGFGILGIGGIVSQVTKPSPKGDFATVDEAQQVKANP